MYLEVPLKLESYIESIKNQTQFIDQKTDRITLLQIGKSKKPEHTKLMYLMYNPFPITLHIDLNFFTDLHNLYKMYPAEFDVAPGTCFAFVMYVNQDCCLNVNEENFTNKLKHQINTRIMRMQNANFKGKYRNSLIFSIQDPEVEIDKTILLNKAEQEEMKKELSQEFIDFDPQFIDKMNIELVNLKTQDNDLVFKFKFSNMSDFNFIVKKVKIKIFDEKQQFLVSLDEQIKFKAHSSKEISVFVKKEELRNIDLTQMQVKINLV